MIGTDWLIVSLTAQCIALRGTPGTSRPST